MAVVKPFFIVFGFELADVVAKLIWQILLPKFGRCYCHNIVVDIVTTCNILMCYHCIGRCYCQAIVADFIANFLMADVIAILLW